MKMLKRSCLLNLSQYSVIDMAVLAHVARSMNVPFMKVSELDHYWSAESILSVHLQGHLRPRDTLERTKIIRKMSSR